MHDPVMSLLDTIGRPNANFTSTFGKHTVSMILDLGCVLSIGNKIYNIGKHRAMNGHGASSKLTPLTIHRLALDKALS